jgi:TolB-like protein
LSLVRELNRRNVFRVGIAYAVVGWLLLQITDVVVPILELPDWVARLVLFLLVLGLVPALIFAWAYELTPEGVKREHEVDRSRSITGQTGRKLDKAIIVLLVLVLAWSAWDRWTAPRAVVEEVPAAEAQDTSPARAELVVAVLPFNATGSDDGGFLATGLHDDLLTLLAKLGAYQVISRTSMMDYAGTTKNMRQIGEELGASHILEGGVQARGGRVRINAQLIDAAEDEHLWAETYDRELTATDLFDVQAELATAIADAMHTTLSPADEVVVNEVPTENLEAYSAYLRGLAAWELASGVGGREDRDAIAAFEEAVRLDPKFAQAWAWLAAAHTKASGNLFEKEASEAALEALARARQLRPGLLEAEIVWAEYQYRQMQEYARAMETLEALGERIEGNVYALSLKAFLNRRLGRFEEGYRNMQSVWRLEPRSPGTYFNLIHFAISVGDCDAAKRHAETLLSLARDLPVALGYVAYYELNCNGDAQRAADLLRGKDWVDIGGLPVSFLAAFAARDAAMILELVAETPRDPNPEFPIWQQLNQYVAYTFVTHDADLAEQALDRAGELLEAYGAEPDQAASTDFSNMKRVYHSARGDAAATRRWVEEHRSRVHNQTKGDVMLAADDRLWYAFELSQVGLYDDAVAELRTMLEGPGGFRFPFADVVLVFEGLQNHPGYAALREQFGE